MEILIYGFGVVTIILLCVALCLFGAFIIFVTFVGFYRFFKRKQTIRFLKKTNSKSIYEVCRTALDVLYDNGAKPEYTMEETENRVEIFKKMI